MRSFKHIAPVILSASLVLANSGPIGAVDNRGAPKGRTKNPPEEIRKPMGTPGATRAPMPRSGRTEEGRRVIERGQAVAPDGRPPGSVKKRPVKPEAKDDVPVIVRPPGGPSGAGITSGPRGQPGPPSGAGRLPGTPPGSGGPASPHDPTGGRSDPFAEWKRFLDGFLAGILKADWGHGIQGDIGSNDPGLPGFMKDFLKGLPVGIDRGPPAPGTQLGGPDAGFYGNISPKYNPGGAAADKDKSPQPGSTGPRVTVTTDPVTGITTTTTDLKTGQGGATITIEQVPNGDTTITHEYGVIASYRWLRAAIVCMDKDGAILRMFSDFGYGSWKLLVSGSGTKFVGPESDSTINPTEDPQLILRLTKTADRQQKGESLRPDVVVSDPVPVKGGDKAAAGGGELAGAGAAKAEAKWRFAGKKPGSGVTDPAEWQDKKIRDFSMARIKHFEVIDPSETQAVLGALAKAQSPSGGGDFAARTAIFSDVAGNVQRLSNEDGQAGWVPLKTGDLLTGHSLVRIGEEGAEIALQDPKATMSLNWRQIYSSAASTVYDVSFRE